jgi:hypothetical protein
MVHLRVLLVCFSSAFLLHLTVAQQYSGASYANSKPNVSGAERTFWNIKDPNNKNASLLNYMIAPNGARQNPLQVQRAVIVIHGLNRDPESYMAHALEALSAASGDNAAINPSSVAIVAPYFANGDDKGECSFPERGMRRSNRREFLSQSSFLLLSGTGYPWVYNATTGRNSSTSSAVVFKGSRWASGDVNQYPTTRPGIASYAVIDQMIQYFDNRSVYPNMKQIVVAGHSLGAQFVNRYSTVGNSLAITTPVSYWIGNPNSLLWLNASRPYDTSSCATYDDWRDGFSSYDVTYGASVARSPTAILSNYNSRSIVFARGLNDFGDDSSDCDPFTTGFNRGDRFYNSIAWFPPTSKWNVDYVPGVGHDDEDMFLSLPGRTRLFVDNFNGDGSRHLDFGPRQQLFDSPNPDPANAPASATNTGTSAGSMVYQGCYNDSTAARTLQYRAGNAGSTNSIETCTIACVNAGYAVAGLEYSTECYCGDALSSTAARVNDASCNMACAGNGNEVCGGPARLSVWSASAPSTQTAPVTVPTAGTFANIGCYTDAASPRTLSDRSTSDDNMTVEKCASFCSGYQYMGTEYSKEVGAR